MPARTKEPAASREFRTKSLLPIRPASGLAFDRLPFLSSPHACRSSRASLDFCLLSSGEYRVFDQHHYFIELARENRNFKKCFNYNKDNNQPGSFTRTLIFGVISNFIVSTSGDRTGSNGCNKLRFDSYEFFATVKTFRSPLLNITRPQINFPPPSIPKKNTLQPPYIDRARSLLTLDPDDAERRPLCGWSFRKVNERFFGLHDDF